MNPSGLIDLVPQALRDAWCQSGLYPDRTVYQMFCQHAQQQPEQLAVLSATHSMSYAALQQAALRLAASLRALGIVAGDVVACQLPNSWHSCAIDLAVAALGAVVAPFPPGRGRLDMEALLKRCDARAMIVVAQAGDIDVCQMIESIRPNALSLRHLIVHDDSSDAVTAADAATALRPGWLSLQTLLQAQALREDELPQVCPNSPVRLLVSSGTESEPKLVAYSHNALLGGRGRFLQRIHPARQSFRGLYLVPLGSSFGSTATFGVLCWLGGSLALLHHFETQAAIAAISQLRPTHILGVPTMLQRMAADPQLARTDKSSLVALISGGSVIDRASIRRCIDAFGCGFISLYGSADGVNCHNTLDQPQDTIFTSVGKPNPDVCSIRIVGEQGQTLDTGEVGEILARGPISPMQYVNAPELDAKYRDSEGWVYTGDLGLIDAHGNLVLAGRKKDIIIRGGANISTVQIENLANSHPQVVDAVCVPVADADLGQRVCLCLVLRDGSERLSLREINQFLREQGLELNKLPEYLRFYRQFPLNPAGKVDKKSLAQEANQMLIRFQHELTQVAA
ncbi:MAG: hypothetical protein RL748_4294 [Pseudomonadota bacterium]